VRTFGVMGLLLALGAGGLGAQQRTGAWVEGTVVDSTGRPLTAQVTVRGEGAPVSVRTMNGKFAAPGVVPGQAAVMVRALGFLPRDTVIDVPRAGVAIAFVLSRVPVVLDTVRVASSKCNPVDFEGFVCRSKVGGGVFLSVHDIDQSGERYAGGLFQNLEGFRVAAAQGDRRVIPIPATGWQCVNELANGRPPSVTNPLPIVSKEVIGVEVYTDPKVLPGEYERYAWQVNRRTRLRERCSVIVYWTTVHERR